jgi:8-oxo-dGTP pyrophosphatase MutT (NUDIX family)
MLKEYLTYLNESIPTKYRKRVEVFIRYQDDKLIVGINKRWGKAITQAPGGGVESGESLERAAEKECLEELGIKIKNPKLLSKKTLKIDWYEAQRRGVNLPEKVRNRMIEYRGSEIYFMKAELKQKSTTGDINFRKANQFRLKILDKL